MQTAIFHFKPCDVAYRIVTDVQCIIIHLALISVFDSL